MLTTNDGTSCAWVASVNGQVEVLRMLVAAGGEDLVMLTRDDGVSSAHVASHQIGHAGVMRMLIEAEGKELVMLTRDDGMSCAHVASQNGHAEVLKMLIEEGG